MGLTHCRRRRNNNGRLRRDCDPVRRVYDGACRDMTSGTAVNSMNPSPPHNPPMGPGTHGERRRLEQNGKGENTAAAARAVSISDTISAAASALQFGSGFNFQTEKEEITVCIFAKPRHVETYVHASHMLPYFLISRSRICLPAPPPKGGREREKADVKVTEEEAHLKLDLTEEACLSIFAHPGIHIRLLHFPLTFVGGENGKKVLAEVHLLLPYPSCTCPPPFPWMD